VIFPLDNKTPSLVYNYYVMELSGYARSSSRLDATFAALADPTRRAILARLAKGDASVSELAEPFAMSQPAISKHLKVLERAGLISRGREAQRRPRRLEARPLREATQWLENYRQFWEAQFGRLDALLREMQAGKLETKSKQRARQVTKEINNET
jgi:DNA-binding transcriptional ArsR family regulator